jgi:hypothetical protein
MQNRRRMERCDVIRGIGLAWNRIRSCPSIAGESRCLANRNLTLCNVFPAIRANRQIQDKSIVLPGNFRLTKPLFLRSTSPTSPRG